jgi:hypothetical protein
MNREPLTDWVTLLVVGVVSFSLGAVAAAALVKA